MTRPWQVGGRNDIPYAERIRLDVDYVLHRSVSSGDLRILGETVRYLLKGQPGVACCGRRLEPRIGVARGNGRNANNPLGERRRGWAPGERPDAG